MSEIETNKPKLLSGHAFRRNFFASASAAFFAIFVVAAFSLFQYEKELLQQKKFEHELLSQRVAKELGMFLAQNATQMVLAGEIESSFKLDSEDMEIWLNNLVLQVPSFESVSYYGLDGREQATSDPRNPGGAPLKWTEALINSTANKEWVSRVMFDERSVPYMMASVPVKSLGREAGFLLARVSLKKMWYWIDELNMASGTRLRVVDSETGVIVADQERRGIQEVYAHWKDRGELSSLYLGNKLISFFHVEGAPLIIVSESALSSFAVEVYHLRYWIVFSAILATAITLVFSIYTARKSTAPVEALIGNIEQYSADRGRRIDEKLPGEFGEIAHAFNAMAVALSEQERQLLEKERLAAVGRIMTGIAHEVRYGLNTIVNQLDEIASGDAKALTLAKFEVKELNEKISDLMEFTVEQTVNPELVVAEEVVWRAVEKARYRTEALENKIIQVESGGKMFVRVDSKKMALVLSNLIRNSLESRKGGVEVLVSAGREDGRFYFSVKDNGPGMDEEVMGKVFIPFYTTKARGFGLGLFLVDLVAKAHKGSVRIVETGPTGTEIRVEIPDKKFNG